MSKISRISIKQLNSIMAVSVIIVVSFALLTSCNNVTSPINSDDFISDEYFSEGSDLQDISSSGISVSEFSEDISSVFSESQITQVPSPTKEGNMFYDEEDKSRQLDTFDFGDVRITGGILKEAFDYWSEFYLNIPNDNILYEYRLRAGISQPPGQRLGGWGIQLQGFYVNEWCSGFARMYAITGNTEFLDKAIYLMEEWYKCFELHGGYHGHYGAGRWVTAMLDVYELTGRQDILDKLKNHYDWCRRNLTFNNKFGDNSTEWYTLSESFYRAYEVTGEQKYFDYAERWEYKEYWDLFIDINNITPFRKPEIGMNTYSYHVISHINSLNGAAMAYRLKGDEYYLTVMKNVYLWLKNDQMYSMGSIGAGLEWALPVNELLVDLNNNHAHAETGATPCYTRYAVNLMTLSGNAEIGDWIEKLHYNDVCAKIKPKQDGIDSIFMSYHDFNLNGGTKTHGWRDQKDLSWTSGAATIPMEIADLHETLYYHEDNNLYLSTYTPSTLKWNRNGNNISVTQKTDYPQTGTVEIDLSLNKNELFSVKLRIPEWARGNVSLTVNGKTAPVKVDSSNWAVLRRNWKNGDKIKLELPMQLWSDRFSNTQYSGIMYGPLAMAVKAPDKTHLSVVDPGSLGQFTKIGNNLQFAHSLNDEVLLKPYYTYVADEQYYFYIKDK